MRRGLRRRHDQPGRRPAVPPDVPADFPTFLSNVTLTGGVAPARAYIEQLLPDVLDGTAEPGKVFDRTVDLDGLLAATRDGRPRGPQGVGPLVIAWTAAELDRMGDAAELQIAGRRADGTLRNLRIVWAVRLGERLFVRSVNGPDAAWYRGVRTRMQGYVWTGGVEKDVTVVDVDHTAGHALDDDLDDAYRAKYGRRWCCWPGRSTGLSRARPRSDSSSESCSTGTTSRPGTTRLTDDMAFDELTRPLLILSC